jgi:hypothetical protein
LEPILIGKDTAVGFIAGAGTLTNLNVQITVDTESITAPTIFATTVIATAIITATIATTFAMNIMSTVASIIASIVTIRAHRDDRLTEVGYRFCCYCVSAANVAQSN